MVEAYELYGCNTADLFIMSISNSDNDAQCIAFDEQHGVEFPTISIEHGGAEINSTYGISAYPTYIVIAPDHSIVVQDIWPVNSVQTFVDVFSNNGIQQASCDATLTADFSANETQVCAPAEVTFTDASNGNVTSWNWTFEGGNPSSSTERNPVVSYETPGVYDVTLTVSDGEESNTQTMEDYVTVNEGVEVTLTPFSDVCVNWSPFELTGGFPEGGTYSGTGVTNGVFFDPALAGEGTHTITYSYTNEFGCSATSSQDIVVDGCIGVDNPEDQITRVYPNPSKGYVNVDVYHVGNVHVKVYNIIGALVYETTENADGHLQFSMDLSHLSGGVYFVETRSEDLVDRQKIEISK